MRILTHQSQEFRWEGDGSASRERRKLHYSSFFLDDEKFSVEDFVLIRNDDSVDPEDISNCYVGRIKELYDTGDAYEPHQAKVQWYSRVTELPPYTCKNFDQVYEHEVIEENRPHFSDTIDADTIFGKCEVHFLPLGVDFTSFDAMLEECEIPSFFCRYKFSGVKLAPKVKNNQDNYSQQNSPMSAKKLNANSDEQNSERKQTNTAPTPKNGTYVAMTTGTKEFPRVLIKRMDDRVLESQNKNVRIIVAQPDALTVDDVADSLRNNLKLYSPAKYLEKRPLIHSLSVNVRETPMIDVLSSHKCSSRKKNSNSEISIQKNSNSEISIQKNSNSEISIQEVPFSNLSKTPSKRNKDTIRTSSTSRSQSCTPKKVPKIENVTLTPSTRTSVRLQNGTPKRLSNIPNTPSPRSSRRVAAIKDEMCMSSSKSAHGKNTPRSRITLKDVETSSPNKRKMTPGRVTSPPPTKTPKTARRSINFSANQGVSVTRSGRKTKPVNYFEQDDLLDKCSKSLFSNTIKKGKLSKFIRINYSDDSGSEFSASDSSSSSEHEGSASDCSLVEKKTRIPHSIQKEGARTRRSLKKKNSELCIPVRKTPLKVAENILEESRLRLHVAAVPKSLPCREEEYSDIYSFVKGCLSAHTGGCMYISGVPGTGKTATVHEVIRNLEGEKEDGDVPLFTFVEVNGMWMTDPYQCYVHIFKSLTGKTIASQQAANLLEKRFTESGPKKEAVILLVDELDRLWTRKQTVMYNIFDWPSKKHSKLIVLAIANTMDLPERLMMNRISSRLGLTRKTFQPYNFRQLQDIIMSRIQELQVFDPDAVQFVARKVAAVSGDARRALDICRHATEVAERSKSSPKKKRKILVGMEHVDEAIQQMFSSPVIAAIKSASKMAKLFLQGMLSEFTRTGSEETTLLKVSFWVTSTLKYEGFQSPSSAEISSVCSQLAASHLILVDNFQNDIYMKIRLSVSPDDVNYALTGKELFH